ncbi:uncharacterized protein LOC106089989 [Stomoxys calcitrans]|uniref:uncharacterized protein LOC106089989 n=1 Tax=Stomoxys calcitrans TaxID=35570 RepID=UPI0027E26377|nr:uncharacterized protein LOC106089989 [Stomoxys calcitrans]
MQPIHTLLIVVKIQNSMSNPDTIVKYESSDVFGENLDHPSTSTMNSYYGDQPHQQGHHQHLNNLTMKRNFDQMQNGGGVPSIATANYNGNSVNSPNINNTYFPPQSYASGGSGALSTSGTEYDMFHHLNARMDLYGTQQQADGKPLKKYKRGESSLLFNPPFFKLLEGFTSPNHKDAIAARCYACGKVVRGNKSISSNFIKHMKRGHPEINKIYDSYKIYRIKTGILPHLSQIVDGKGDTTFDKDNSCGLIGDSNDENGAYIGTSAILDSSEICEGEEENKHSENSENDDDSTSMTNNRQSADVRSGNSENIAFQSGTTEPSSKLLEAINIVMEDKLKEFVKQTDFQQFAKMISDKNSITSEDKLSLMELRKEVEHLKQECAALRLAVQHSQASKRQLQHELQSVDKMLHQRKLIIRNLKVADSTDLQSAVQRLFVEKLGLEGIHILNCVIIPSARICPDTDKKCVLVELQNHTDVKTIFRQIPKLKDTGIFIESEISPAQRKRKDKLMIVRKELLRRKPDIKVMVRDCTLVVNSQQFYWDNVEGLCHDANKEALELNAIEYLKVLTSVDLREFIDILQNYDVQVR